MWTDFVTKTVFPQELPNRKTVMEKNDVSWSCHDGVIVPSSKPGRLSIKEFLVSQIGDKCL